MKDIKDYLHFYLGCQCEYGSEDAKETRILEGMDYSYDATEAIFGIKTCPIELVKPILRPLSDMTEEEMKELFWMRHKMLKEMYPDAQVGLMLHDVKRTTKHGTGVGFSVFEKPNGNHYMTGTFPMSNFEPEQFAWLLKNDFDLFNLIPENLAIDKNIVK